MNAKTATQKTPTEPEWAVLLVQEMARAIQEQEKPRPTTGSKKLDELLKDSKPVQMSNPDHQGAMVHLLSRAAAQYAKGDAGNGYMTLTMAMGIASTLWQRQQAECWSNVPEHKDVLAQADSLVEEICQGGAAMHKANMFYTRNHPVPLDWKALNKVINAPAKKKAKAKA